MNDKMKPTRQAIAVRGRSMPGKVTGKLKAALERMVWFGDKRAAAAESAGMADHSLRAALKKPHVLAHYRAELAALRESERSRTLHAYVDVRDNSDNSMARVAAGRALNADVDRQPEYTGPVRAPGFQIVVIGREPAPAGPVIDVKPAEADNGEGDGES